MRVIAYIFVLFVIIFNVANSLRFERSIYDALLSDLEREMVERELADRVLAKRQLISSSVDRVRRASEKKSYPRNCYFSPIQCLFTRP